MRKLIATLLVCVFVTPPPCAGQAPDHKHVETVKKKVASCLENSRHLFIETYDDRKLQGLIGEAGPESFVLSFGGKSTTLNYADVKKIKWPSAMSKAAKTAILATTVVGGLLLGVVLLGGLKN